MKSISTKITALLLSACLAAGLVGGSVTPVLAAEQPEAAVSSVETATEDDADSSTAPESNAEADPASSETAEPDADGSSVPASSEPAAEESSSLPGTSQPEESQVDVSVPNASSEIMSDDADGEPEPDISAQATFTLAQLLETARQDGTLAAEMLNSLEEEEWFLSYLDEVLQVYYTENLPDQLADFTAAVDQRAADALARYAAAAAERAEALAAGYMPGEVLLVFDEDTGDSAIGAAADAIEGEVTQTIETEDATIAVAELPLDQTVTEAVEEYNALPGVSEAQPNYVYQLLDDATSSAAVNETMAAASSNDPHIGNQYYLNQINVGGAWDILQSAAYLNRSKVLVSVIDTGCYTAHPDLQGVLDLSRSADFSTGSRRALNGDQDVHGTHVIGTIAANTGNGIGVAGVASAPGNRNIVSVMAVNVFQWVYGYSEPVASTSTLVPAINYSVSQGARVINMSLGHYNYDSTTDPLTEQAINSATAKGTLVVCAAGNNNTSTPMYPSDFENSLSVIALDSSGNRAMFSNGYGSDYGSSKDIAAPGVDIFNTIPTMTINYTSYSYYELSGTSMASPQVAAAAAMVLYASPDLSAGQVRNILCGTASRSTVGRNNQVGWGCINIEAAIRSATAGSSTMRTVAFPAASQTTYIGTRLALSATVSGSGSKTLMWESSNTAVATVSGGSVNPLAVGTAVITATLDNGKSASCIVTVKSPVTSVRVSQKSAALVRGKKLSISAKVYTTNNSSLGVTWKSNKTGVATVSAKGVITGKSAGTATITATAPGGKTARVTVRVLKASVSITQLTVSGAPSSLVVGKTKFITASVKPYNATGVAVKFSSNRPSILHVDATGKLTAKKAGTATITVKAGGKTVKKVIKVVKAPATKITLTTTTLSLKKGAGAALKFTVTPSNANRAVTYTSNNKKVATVTSKGRVKAVGKGTCYITVKTASGKKARCKITVK